MVLLKSMVEHGIDKIVFSSTAATYGEPESLPIKETDRTMPTNTYGETLELHGYGTKIIPKAIKLKNKRCYYVRQGN